jgi:hypothetical protein
MGVEKYKWTFALIMLVALITLASIIFSKYPIILSDDTFKWLMPILFSGWAGGAMVFLRWVSLEEEKKWNRDIEEMKKKTNETDSLQRVEQIMKQLKYNEIANRQQLKAHEEVNKEQIDAVHEVLSIIDHKMDLLLEKNLNKSEK